MKKKNKIIPDTQIIPGFKAVEFQRKVRAENSRLMKNMTSEEIIDFVRRGAEEFRRSSKARPA
jgi:hypothetical protein